MAMGHDSPAPLLRTNAPHYRRLQKLKPDAELVRRRANGEALAALAPDYDTTPKKGRGAGAKNPRPPPPPHPGAPRRAGTSAVERRGRQSAGGDRPGYRR